MTPSDGEGSLNLSWQGTRVFQCGRQTLHSRGVGLPLKDSILGRQDGLAQQLQFGDCRTTAKSAAPHDYHIDSGRTTNAADVLVESVEARSTRQRVCHGARQPSGIDLPLKFQPRPQRGIRKAVCRQGRAGKLNVRGSGTQPATRISVKIAGSYSNDEFTL